MIIGAHVPTQDPLRHAAEVGAECLQMFLGDPQSYRVPPSHPQSRELESSGIPVYIHAPYRINVASPNNRIRIPSRKLLAGVIDKAAELGAAGVIVHAGHAEDDVERGFFRWRKVFEELDPPRVPLLIENTAGGDNAMARNVDTLAQLWDMLEDCEVGFCFDTCHAHAAGEDLTDVVQRVLKITGRIDVLHANNSRDPFGCGRDRHANFSSGEMSAGAILEMVDASGATAVVCETPWPGIADDMEVLRAHLS